MLKMARLGIGLAVLVALTLVANTSGDDKKKDVSIKDVMEKGHKGKPPLCGKVVGGKATKEEKEQLLELYVALSKCKPSKGEAASWKEKTDALVAATKACIADDKDGVEKYKKAVNCKACHDVHKGK